MNDRIWFALCGLVVISAHARAQDPPSNVAEIQAAHDRALIRDLNAYLAKNPKADDAEQAYMTLFDKTIQHDWFADQETLAQKYRDERPDGPVSALARIVATMARAQAGRFDEALTVYQQLMSGVGKAEQEEFAVNFSDSFANAALAAGEHTVARRVYETVLDRFGENPNLKQRIKADLDRLDKIGKPAPALAVKDVKGETLRLDDLRGKYVLVDFWATWCAPCIAELPRLQAARTKYGASNFEIVGVSLDETKTALTDFVKARAVPWRQVHNASAGGDLVEAFGVTTIPATFLIDPSGAITRLELRGPALDQALAKLLKAPRVSRAPAAAPTR